MATYNIATSQFKWRLSGEQQNVTAHGSFTLPLFDIV
jgi:hypothetical protein